MVLDNTDLKLLQLLKENARASYASLARELGISESAVRKRIAKLVKMGVIKRFTIEYSLGNEIRAVILVKTSPQVPVPDISQEILKLRWIEAVYEVTGEYDILAMIRANSIKDINDCIDKIRAIKGVSGTY
ncbi:MAG TPA: Lrp/AsnC family transcriptional regulator, partial [Desulfurococcaceae archaeon]|nr:Lrp/AsnC family transcriptional regulator [Desulfurococcaceae archaeon]